MISNLRSNGLDLTLKETAVTEFLRRKDEQVMVPKIVIKEPKFHANYGGN